MKKLILGGAKEEEAKPVVDKIGSDIVLGIQHLDIDVAAPINAKRVDVDEDFVKEFFENLKSRSFPEHPDDDEMKVITGITLYILENVPE